jgi:hypothetical protein
MLKFFCFPQNANVRFLVCRVPMGYRNVINLASLAYAMSLLKDADHRTRPL